MQGKHNRKQIAQMTKWVKHTCDIFPQFLMRRKPHPNTCTPSLCGYKANALAENFHLQNHHDAAQFKTTRILLQKIDISPLQSTFKHFNADSTVYICLSLDRKYAAFNYIGCTAHNSSFEKPAATANTNKYKTTSLYTRSSQSDGGTNTTTTTSTFQSPGGIPYQPTN